MSTTPGAALPGWREVWHDAGLSDELESRAADLRDRLRQDFWMEQRGCHALALDGDKRQVDSLTSNLGHVLWSGILDDDEAATTATRLLEDDLYSGWGVRTLGTRETGYTPLGYHTGAVWPHENSLIAAGLARYGQHEAARTVPMAFPTASRPQAWPAAAPLLMLTTVLGLTPESPPDVESTLPAPSAT